MYIFIQYFASINANHKNIQTFSFIDKYNYNWQ